MTYNIRGLPWPVAMGRSADLDDIAARLRAMRSQAAHPHIVVMQEAFTQDAQAIGHEAGYAHVVGGPGPDMVNMASMSSEDRGFLSNASLFKGEGAGKYVGSGLQLLTDYPVLSVRRMVFPAFACAGYDCLANKGALLVSLAVPGMSVPVDVVTTHLNSRRASGVDNARSMRAYRRQIDLLSGFIARAHDPRRPLIVAGDFNVTDDLRRAALMRGVDGPWAGAPMQDALNQAERQGIRLSSDARAALDHARDWQFFSGGAMSSLAVTGVQVPFGHDAQGAMLSDHIGYTALYRLTPERRAGREVAATSDGRPKA
ncbi:endonuclease/exonuclease/phosphatase family protein [Sphingobium aquiterrae]|uniref:endonuclease/exonuclease/phosphatase family protein n=1 Tax=Sphingobium aquiterrae TaxID=2038656 RepID=UPI0030186C63